MVERERSAESKSLDIDIEIILRSGQADVKFLQTVLKTLIGPLNSQSESLHIVLTEQEVKSLSKPGGTLSTLRSIYYIK